MRNPYVVGIVNAIIPGAGYIAIRSRRIFGILLLIGTVLWVSYPFVEPVPPTNGLFYSTTLVGKTIEAFTILLFTFAFGYDAYQEAKRS